MKAAGIRKGTAVAVYMTDLFQSMLHRAFNGEL
jgi:hypothetical protein